MPGIPSCIRLHCLTGLFLAPGAPLAKRIELAELSGYLPPHTPTVTPVERAEILRQRAEDVARRFAL